VRRADNLATFMCRWTKILGASTAWNPKGLSRLYRDSFNFTFYTCDMSAFYPDSCLVPMVHTILSPWPTFRPWGHRQQVPPKHWYPSVILHNTTSYKTKLQCLCVVLTRHLGRKSITSVLSVR
jgi:hypothetical protein